MMNMKVEPREAMSPATATPSMLLFIAWRNVWRNPVRSVLTISALAGGLVMVILYSALLEGMTRDMVRYATEVTTGHIQIHRRAFIDDHDLYATLPWSWMEAIERELPSVRLAPRLYAAGLASSEESSTGVLLKGVDPKREAAVTRMLGHLRGGEMRLGPADTTDEGIERHNVVVGAQLAKNIGVEPGDELVLVTQAADGSIGNGLYRVAGVLKPLEPGFDRMGVLMSVDAFQQLMYLEEGFHELAVRIDDITQTIPLRDTLQRRLDALSAAHPLDPLGGEAIARDWRQITPAISDVLEMSRSMLLFVGLIVVGLASLGVLNTMLMAVHERTQEFGILLAIGMKRRWLLLMVLFESLLLALVSAALGAAGGALAANWLVEHGIDFSASMPDGYDWAGMVFEPVMRGHLEPIHILNGSLLMVLITLIAALLPAWRAARRRPAEVMR